jgi:hypothetical protein
MNNAAFTIVAKNYIGLAQTLELSLKKYFKDLSFYIFVADEIEHEHQNEIPENVLVAKEVLGISEHLWDDMSFKYNLVEFCTAIKPAAFKYLLEKTSCNKFIYLDPDVYFFSSIEPIFNNLDKYSILITPHIVNIQEYYTGDKVEKDFFVSGVYNLGFCGISRTRAAEKMINWWHQRLADKCFADMPSAYFTDQKWIDFLPCFFSVDELLVIRDLGLNVAPWNFFEREVYRKDGTLWVKPRNKILQECTKPYPLIFVHFSGFNYTKLMQGVEQDRVSKLVKNYKDVGQIFEAYSKALVDSSKIFEKYISLSYSYDTFDNYDNIYQFHRRIYRGLADKGKLFAKPFAVGKGSFHENLKKRGMISNKSINLDKETKSSLPNLGLKLKIFNSFMRIVYKIMGYKRYVWFVSLLRSYSRFESQIFLLDSKYDRNNIL